MNALVTGVTGFAGSFLAEHLLACGDRVLGCSRSGRWPGFIPKQLTAQVPLLCWDLAKADCPPSSVQQQIAQFAPECIYHLAGISVPDDCGEVEPTSQAVATNVDGAARILELANGLPQAAVRVVFASSSYVYAPVMDTRPVDEELPLAPGRAYGRTKLAAENLLRRAVERHRAEVVIARPFQHAGPRQNARMMLAQWCRQFAVGGERPVGIYSRSASIDLTDVRDVACAYRLLALRGRSGAVYNVGTGVPRTSGAIFDMLYRLAGSSRGVVEIQPRAKQNPIADHTRLSERTGWVPTIPLEQTVSDTLDFWRKTVLDPSVDLQPKEDTT